MNDKATIETLKAILVKYPLATDESEALRDAIGILAWTALAESRMKRMKASREKRFEDDKRSIEMRPWKRRK